MIQRPPRATLTDTLFPYTTLFRSEALAAEVRSFGIRVTLVEPGPYATDFFDHDGSAPLAIYNPLREQSAKLLTKDFVGDPTATWPAIEAVVDAEDPHLRLILGDMLPLVRQTYARRLPTWERQETLRVGKKGAT